MPEYSCYYDAQEPVLTKRYIDDIKNLKVGDYLSTEHLFNRGGGMTKVYSIVKITDHFVYIEKLCEYSNVNQQVRLTWEEKDRLFDDSLLSKGCLKNKKYNTTFCYYVKQEEMDLTQFNRTDTLLRGCA
jgi:hypothetical protein